MYMLFMLLASAAFKGEDIQNFGEGGRTLYGGGLAFYGGLNNPLETMIKHKAICKQQERFQILSICDSENAYSISV